MAAAACTSSCAAAVSRVTRVGNSGAVTPSLTSTLFPSAAAAPKSSRLAGAGERSSLDDEQSGNAEGREERMEHPEEEEPDRREGDVLKYIQKFESGECWVILVSFCSFVQ